MLDLSERILAGEAFVVQLSYAGRVSKHSTCCRRGGGGGGGGEERTGEERIAGMSTIATVTSVRMAYIVMYTVCRHVQMPKLAYFGNYFPPIMAHFDMSVLELSRNSTRSCCVVATNVPFLTKTKRTKIGRNRTPGERQIRPCSVLHQHTEDTQCSQQGSACYTYTAICSGGRPGGMHSLEHTVTWYKLHR